MLFLQIKFVYLKKITFKLDCENFFQCGNFVIPPHCIEWFNEMTCMQSGKNRVFIHKKSIVFESKQNITTF